MVREGQSVDIVAGGHAAENVQGVADARHRVPIELVKFVVQEVVFPPRYLAKIQLLLVGLVVDEDHNVVFAAKRVGH